MNRRGFAAFALILLIFIFASPGYSQSNPVRVEGTVFDPAGAVIVNEKIVFENSLLKSLIVTDEIGSYAVELPPGEYKVRMVDTGWLPLNPDFFQVTSGNPITKNLYPVPDAAPRCILKVVVPFEVIVPSVNTPLSYVKQQIGQVKGVVTDIQGARIPESKVVFEDAIGKLQTKGNEAGEYSMDLPIGVYSVTVSSPWFCNFRRFAFQVKPNAQTTLNAALRAFGTHVGCGNTESFEMVKADTGEPTFIRIQYGERKVDKEKIEYKRVSDGDFGDEELVVLYDGITIRAEKIWLNKSSKYLEAEGDVVIEQGRQVIKVKRAEFDYNAKNPIVRLEN